MVKNADHEIEKAAPYAVLLVKGGNALLELLHNNADHESTSTMKVRRKYSSADFISLMDFSKLAMEGGLPTPCLSSTEAMLSSSSPYKMSRPRFGMPSTRCTLSTVTEMATDLSGSVTRVA
ncbi:hypothetical protein D1007_38841 [Hordeum vulgare]|nr:hypothetical protein D1007_38841 [Hordeum vulgare]